MRTCWLIETDVFPQTAAGIAAAVERLGLEWVRYHDDVCEVELPDAEQPVVFWGSLGAAYDACVAARWTPGAIGEISRFRCRTYYRELAACDLANDDAVFATAAQLAWVPDHVLAPLGNPDAVFVRPDSPLKPFAGRWIAVSKLSLEALEHGFYYDDEHLPVVVASVKRVTGEWRFVVADGRIVAECGYDPRRRATGRAVPAPMREVADRVARASWQAAPVYVVDVGEVNGQPRVLELNPFSGADLYECDPGAVVAAATEVAIRLHGEASDPAGAG